MRDGDVVSVRERSWDMPVFHLARENAHVATVPATSRFDAERLQVRVLRQADRDEIPSCATVQLVVEYYAR